MAGQLVRMLEEEGVQVTWTPPLEERGTAEIVTGVVVVIEASGAYDVIKATATKFVEKGRQRGDEIVDGAGEHAVDVGLHHHRIEGLIDAATRFEDRREERTLAELGDAQLDIAGLGRDQARMSAFK